MATPAEIGALVFDVVMAVVLVLVGRVVWQRRPAGAARLAGTAFATWWFVVALLRIIPFVDLLVTRTIGWSLAAYITFTQAILMIISIAFAALLYYMVYLFTGKERSWLPIGIGYAIVFLLLLHWITAAGPVAINAGNVSSEIEYQTDPTDSPMSALIAALLLLPIILAALGYLSLYFKVEERSQRFRIATIGGAFTLWFGSTLVLGQATDVTDSEWWPTISSLITLVAAAAVYAAFQPPQWMRHRLHIRGFGEHDT